MHFIFPVLLPSTSLLIFPTSCASSIPCLLPLPTSPPPLSGRSGLAASYLSVKALVPQMPKLLKSLFPARDDKKELRPSPHGQQVGKDGPPRSLSLSPRYWFSKFWSEQKNSKKRFLVKNGAEVQLKINKKLGPASFSQCDFFCLFVSFVLSIQQHLPRIMSPPAGDDSRVKVDMVRMHDSLPPFCCLILPHYTQTQFALVFFFFLLLQYKRQAWESYSCCFSISNSHFFYSMRRV